MKSLKKTLIGMTAAALAGTMIAATAFAAPAPASPTAMTDLTANEIGMTEAVQVALKASGLSEAQAEFSKKVNEFSNGAYIYDIHFLNRDNIKYEFEIDAFTGTIREQDQDFWEADDNFEYQGLQAAGQAFFNLEDPEVQAAMEKAFKASVADAGVAEADIITYKYGIGYENGKVVLDAGFFIPGNMKYDYDVDLQTGAIVDRDTDYWEADDDLEFKGLLATAPAPAQAPAPSGAITDADAKAIALANAGFAEGDVRMTKCEKDFDNGIEKYEVDFFGPDGMKYEYDIRVSDGTILEKDVDYDD